MDTPEPLGTADEQRAADLLATLFPEGYKELSQYVDILSNRGIEWGLVGPREGDKLWQRHVANSLALLDVIPHGVDVADVGTGAGLPGIPLAIVRPDLRVTLIESLKRRTDFLELAVSELGLQERVTIVRARAEEVKEHYDLVDCRAVAPLEKLIRWTTPLSAPHGVLVALKGESAEEEIRQAAKGLKAHKLTAEILELQVIHGIEGTRAVRVRRS